MNDHTAENDAHACPSCGSFVGYLDGPPCLTCHYEPRVIPPAGCDTCGGAGRVPWMVEADPNCYQEPDAEGTIPCSDCRVIPPRSSALPDEPEGEA